DAVTATMSFLGDAQEFPAIVLTELHIEMLALNLQFFRLDDVIHFSWAANSTAVDLRNGRKIRSVFCASSRRRLLRRAPTQGWTQSPSDGSQGETAGAAVRFKHDGWEA